MDKVKWRHLLPLWEQIEDMAKVMSKGGEKYPLAGWKEMKDGTTVNEEKMLRHFTEYQKGITKDEESGLHPLAHVAVRTLMLLWHEQNKSIVLEDIGEEKKAEILKQKKYTFPFELPEFPKVDRKPAA